MPPMNVLQKAGARREIMRGINKKEMRFLGHEIRDGKL